ncbi:MAG: hypothetical protein QOC60_75, partial [Frankiaceae bacterium]|nr:hypothetical protein [Frankiaceae bacterium]
MERKRRLKCAASLKPSEYAIAEIGLRCCRSPARAA